MCVIQPFALQPDGSTVITTPHTLLTAPQHRDAIARQVIRVAIDQAVGELIARAGAPADNLRADRELLSQYQAESVSEILDAVQQAHAAS